MFNIFNKSKEKEIKNLKESNIKKIDLNLNQDDLFINIRKKVFENGINTDKVNKDILKEIKYIWSDDDITSIFKNFIPNEKYNQKEFEDFIKEKKFYLKIPTLEDIFSENFREKYLIYLEFTKNFGDEFLTLNLQKNLELYLICKEVDEKIKYYKKTFEEYKRIFFEYFNEKKSIPTIYSDLKNFNPDFPILLSNDNIEFYKNADFKDFDFNKLYLDFINFEDENIFDTFFYDEKNEKNKSPLYKYKVNSYNSYNTSAYESEEEKQKALIRAKLSYKFKLLNAIIQKTFQNLERYSSESFLKANKDYFYDKHIFKNFITEVLEYCQNYQLDTVNIFPDFIKISETVENKIKKYNFEILNSKMQKTSVCIEKDIVFDFSILEKTDFMYNYFKFIYPIALKNKEDLLIKYNNSKDYLFRYVSHFFDNENPEYVNFIKSNIWKMIILNENNIEVFNILEDFKNNLSTSIKLERYEHETFVFAPDEWITNEFMDLAKVFFKNQNNSLKCSIFQEYYKKHFDEKYQEKVIEEKLMFNKNSEYSLFRKYLNDFNNFLIDLAVSYGAEESEHNFYIKENFLIIENKNSKELKAIPFLDKFLGSKLEYDEKMIKKFKNTNLLKTENEKIIPNTFYLEEFNNKTILKIPSFIKNNFNLKEETSNITNFNVPYYIQNFIEDYYKLGYYNGKNFIPYFSYEESKNVKRFNSVNRNIILGGEIDNYNDINLKMIILRNLIKDDTKNSNFSLINRFTLDKDNPYILNILANTDIVIKHIFNYDEVSNMKIKFENEEIEVELKDVDSWKLFTKNIKIINESKNIKEIINTDSLKDDFSFTFYIEIELLGIKKEIEKTGKLIIPCTITKDNFIRRNENLEEIVKNNKSKFKR